MPFSQFGDGPLTATGQFFVINSSGATAIASPVQNTSKVWAFIAPLTVMTTNITLTCNTADNTANSYDVGLYDASGTLLVHTGLLAGTTLFAATGVRNFTWVAPGTTIAGQRYYFAWSTNAAAPAAAIGGTNSPSPAIAAAGPVPSSGTLVSGAMPADSWLFATFPTFAIR